MTRSSKHTDTVSRCVARHDGGWLVVTLKGQSGSSSQQIPVGARVVIRGGVAERAR